MPRRVLAKTIGLALLSVATIGTGLASPQANERAVEVQMRNIEYHFTDTIAVHIRTLRGRLQPKENGIPVFDNKDSFNVEIDRAEMSMTAASLANVLNSYVFAKPDAPLKNISIRIENGELDIKGKLHSRGDVPFETRGRVTATEDGRIRLHAEHIKALHLPVKGLMDLLGLEASSLIKTEKVQGVKVDGDDFLLDPESLLPPPHIRGKITAIRTEGGEIVQVFGGKAKPEMQVSADNYMAYRGNQLRFGKLTMNDTDMVLIDMDPKDPFDFDLDHYKEQLVAGYTKETPAFGLRVYMRDYNKLHRVTMGRPGAAARQRAK